MTDLETIILLNSCAKLHLRNIETYLEKHESLQAILKEDSEISQRCQRFDLVKEMKEVRRLGIDLIAFSDERYPGSLKVISSPPLLLYVRGILRKEELAIAIVGARKATPYGLKIAHDWAMEIVSYDVAIVSGLALGIDGAAHEGALRGKGRTLAVLGSGLGILYPPEHQKLAERIAENGAVISEFPMNVGPDVYHFPRRNRIISGLSIGVIIVEAGEKSGALVTAGLALEQGKEVFALPGRVDSPTSVGTHRLIKDGARMALSPQEILAELSLPILQRFNDQTQITASDHEKENHWILKHLSQEPISLEALVQQIQVPVAQLISTLSTLEVMGKVVQFPGARYVKR